MLFKIGIIYLILNIEKERFKLRLIGRLIRETTVLSEKVVEKSDNSVSFRELLEENFIVLCKELDISVPLWLKRNTTEFARFRKTYFTKEQFIDSIEFDRFEIKID